jgi:hypothetical protein
MGRVLALLVAAIVVPAAALAQGSISGTVTDASRRPLPGVTVIAVSPPPAAPSRPVVTDREGRFVIGDLDPSRTYTVSFVLPGFELHRRTDVSASAGGPPLDVSLRVGALAETLAVPVPQLDLSGPRLSPQVPGRMCLHDTAETAAEAERRSEALRAMRLIARAIVMATGDSRPARFPSWEALASSPAVETLKQGSGAAAELARKMAWGTTEPLPGWRVSYVATLLDVRFALADERDPCGFTYSSADPQVIPPAGRLRPLT